MRDLAKVQRRKIMIQHMTTYIDDRGNQRKDWVDWNEFWAKRSNLWGETYYAAAVAGEENTVEFEIRYIAFLEDLIHNVSDYRVVFEGVEYEIKHVDPLKDGGDWIKLKCLERGAGG